MAKKSKKDKKVVMTKDDARKIVTDFASSGSAVIMIDAEGETINAGIPLNSNEKQRLLFDLATQHLKFLSYAPVSVLRTMLEQSKAKIDKMTSEGCGDPECKDCKAESHADDDDDDDGFDIIFDPELELDPIRKKISRKKMQ